jgi:hypothetical protein
MPVICWPSFCPGHSDFKTTLIYADYQPSEREAELIEAAFASGVGPAPPVSSHATGFVAFRAS